MASTPDMTRNYMVADYLSSKKAIDDISNRMDLRKVLARGGADQCARMSQDFDGFFARVAESLFGKLAGSRPWCGRSTIDMPQEEFVEYWKGLVTSSYDPITGLAPLK